MSDRVPAQPEANFPFAPKPKARPEGNFVAEESGHAIIALLKKAADMAKEDCARVMDVAHNCRFKSVLLKSEREKLRPRPRTFAIARHVPKHGCSVSATKLSKRFSRDKEGEGSSP